MRILHTADWHLGKRLHRHSLHRHQVQFIEWLLQTVEGQAVDAVLVAGDIFDTANPSSEARNLYYSALARLHALGCQVIITGGNHDSPSVLEAPRSLLKALNIHVLGEKTASPADMLTPVYDAAGTPAAMVSTVPFLRDGDLRRLAGGETESQREEAVRQGIARVFQEQADEAHRHGQGVPQIAMGHLFVRGVSTSDSERDIQVGNQASVEDSVFSDIFDYVALGHIHKPQRVGAQKRIFYSGSPIPLSFSEYQDQKRVMLLEVNDDGLRTQSLPVPTYFRLPRMEGTLPQIREKLQALVPEEEALIEISLKEPHYHPDLPVQLNELVDNHNQHHPRQPIIHQRIEYGDKITSTSELYGPEQDLNALTPQAVFRECLQQGAISDENRELLEDAFQEILEEIRQDENLNI